MDSTFTADQPGIYHVTVTDYCGNQLRDTVVITLAPDVPFDLGPDISICNEDTVTLTAPTGFTNYYWSPSYRVSNSYTRQIKVNPDRDTTYTVVAERGPGCLVSDTIRVKVNRPTPLDLGIDKTFCRNDSVLLDAGPSFSDYIWNNNLTTQQIYAITGGSYHVTATDINGCKSRDTVDIVMNELPAVNLGGDTIICRNTGVLFNPGIGNAFNTYLWQDGSTNNTYFGTQAGTYWVEVTNAYHCKNADTVRITRVAELPSNFLADTIGICDGEQIELRASRSFVSYQWDGLFNTPAITVKDESGHVLKVTDEYGCTGEDTIRVYFKFCRKRIWFPNAFTPNNDAHNSTFKPIVDGGLVKFHLVIYNRWGQKVFETQDARRGWDGTVSGHTQDTNTFVWVCTYKFIGRDQVEQTEKGVVIVVR
jgi:gliding motility-associated-like protein